MKKVFSIVLALIFVLGIWGIGQAQEIKKVNEIKNIGDIVEIPGASENFIVEGGFRGLDSKGMEFVKYFMDIMNKKFSELAEKEIENIGMAQWRCIGIRGVDSDRFAILIQDFAIGIATDEENFTGPIIQSDLAFVYYLDDLQSAPETGENSLSQIADEMARKFLDSIKEKIR